MVHQIRYTNQPNVFSINLDIHVRESTKEADGFVIEFYLVVLPGACSVDLFEFLGFQCYQLKSYFSAYT